MAIDLDPGSVPTVSERCFGCFRPRKLCYCDLIPTVDNLTEVLILQHRRERFHPFNTARMVRDSLRRCQLLVDHNDALADKFNLSPLSENVGLLYPGESARDLAQLSADQRPDQLVILDGTWHHAKTLMRDIPRLRRLPQYRLAPALPGRYRIRREPNDQALSTIEAIVAALRLIEPETDGLDQLLQVFEQMIDTQISHSSNMGWRKNLRRRQLSTNIPQVLCGDLAGVVVAYGEQEQGKDSRFKNSDLRKPIYWVAQRIDDGRRFECAIEPKRELTDDFLDHLRLTKDDFRDAVSIDRFRHRWNSFLRPDDRLAVYHSSTASMLRRIEADCARPLILKSINQRSGGTGGTLDDFLDQQQISRFPSSGSRASQRLANALAYVRFLNAMHA